MRFVLSLWYGGRDRRFRRNRRPRTRAVHILYRRPRRASRSKQACPAATKPSLWPIQISGPARTGWRLAKSCKFHVKTAHCPVLPRRLHRRRRPPATTEQRPLRIMTGSGYAPFTDDGLENGRALTHMVRMAVMKGNPGQEFNLNFVNDWRAHLDSLLPTRGMDMTFPWFRPDCSKVEFLSDASAMRCTQFNHSDPLYDPLVGYYTLNGSAYADATSYSDLMGARICRPEAWFTFDLEAEQLTPANVEPSQNRLTDRRTSCLLSMPKP